MRTLIKYFVVFYIGWTLGTFHGIRVQRYRSRSNFWMLLSGAPVQQARPSLEPAGTVPGTRL